MDIRALQSVNLEIPITPAFEVGVQKAAPEHHGALNIFDADVCAVCLQQEFVDTALLPCRHAFHGGCIVQWVEANFSCPLCRRTIEQFLPLEEDGGQRLQFDPTGPLSLAEFDMGQVIERQRSQEIFGRFIAIWEQHYLEGRLGTQEKTFKISDDPVKLSMMRSMSHTSMASMHSDLDFSAAKSSLRHSSSFDHNVIQLSAPPSPVRCVRRGSLTTSKSYPTFSFVLEEKKEEEQDLPQSANVSAYLDVDFAPLSNRACAPILDMHGARAPILDMNGVRPSAPSPLPSNEDKLDFSAWEIHSEAGGDAQGEVETNDCEPWRMPIRTRGQSITLSKVPPVMEVAAPIIQPSESSPDEPSEARAIEPSEARPSSEPRLNESSEPRPGLTGQFSESKSDFVAENVNSISESPINSEILVEKVVRQASRGRPRARRGRPHAHRGPASHRRSLPSKTVADDAFWAYSGDRFLAAPSGIAQLGGDMTVVNSLKSALTSVMSSIASAVQFGAAELAKPDLSPPTLQLPVAPVLSVRREEPMARTSNHLKAGLVSGAATAGLVHAFDGHAGRFLRSVGFVNGLKGGMVLFHSNFLSFSFLRTLHTVMPSVGMYFAVYELMKRNAFYVKDPESRPVAQFGAWMASGGVAAAVGHMILKSSPLIPLRYAMQFGVFEWAKQRWAKYDVSPGAPPRELSPLAVMTTAALGGVAAHSVIYPISQLRSALAAAPKVELSPILAGAFGSPERVQPVGTFSRLQAALGSSGLYRGYRPALIRFLPPCVLTATTYEFSLRYFGRKDEF